MRTFFISLVLACIAAEAAAVEACKSPAACDEVQTCGSAACCGRCGCACSCEKYCKVVCGTKEVKKHVWVVKCSDFCAPLPNRGGKCCGDCENCATDAEPACCDDCGTKCDPCAVERDKCRIPPKCGKVRPKKTLEKKEITCKVPSYKCVVVYCCPNCGANECGVQQAAPDSGKTTSNAPLPPVIGTSFVK